MRRLALLAALLACSIAPSRALAQSFTLALGGDVIFEAPLSYALRARRAADDDPRSYDELFEALRGPLERADLAIVNLETPVGPRRRSRDAEQDYPTFAAPPAFVEALAGAGVDLVTLANNHAYDQGVAGLASTIAETRRVGLEAAGLDEAPGFTLRVVRGVRVAIVSLTQGTNVRPTHDEAPSPRVAVLERAQLEAWIRGARASADVVVAALHFTDTGERMPSRAMRAWARRAALAGADVVVGHGPHVPAAAEWLELDGRRALVLNSLGNLVAAMRAERHAEATPRPHVRDAVIVTLRITRTSGGVSIEPPSVATYWIEARRTSAAPPLIRPFSTRAGDADPLSRRAARLVALLDARGPPTPARALTTEPPPAVTARLEADVVDPSATRPPVSAPRASAARPAREPTPPSAERLGARFLCGSAVEASVDGAALRAWAERLRAAAAARLVVVSTRCPGEPEALARRRARRASGLVAILGPSRSRLTFEVGPTREGEPELTAQLR